MAQCHAISGRRNARCTETSVHGSRYCSDHYPKKGLFYFFCIGILLGVAGVSLLHFSLADSVERWQMFHYMDRTPPQIEYLSPDIRRFKNVDRGLRSYQLQVSDTGAGMDWQKSRFAIKQNIGGNIIWQSGQMSVKDGSLFFESDADLSEGNYSIDAVLVDLAGRESHFMDSFTVERQDVRFSVKQHRFGSNDVSSWSNQNFEKHLLAQENLFVYRIDIFHETAPDVILKNLKSQIEFPGTVLAFREIGSTGTDRKIPFPISQGSFWKPKAFPERKWIEIGELDAHGAAAFEAVIKCSGPVLAQRQALLISGSYDYQSYRKAETRDIGVWVPVAEKDSL